MNEIFFPEGLRFAGAMRWRMGTVTFLALAVLASTFAVVRMAPARFRLALWCVVIVGAVVPWTGYQDHTHWDRVQWIPLVPPPDLTLRDIALNLLLYIPVGMFWPSGRTGRPHLGLVVAAAVGFSLATEWTQIYSHGRFPAATDVVINALGALAGALTLRVWQKRPPSG